MVRYNKQQNSVKNKWKNGQLAFTSCLQKQLFAYGYNKQHAREKYSTLYGQTLTSRNQDGISQYLKLLVYLLLTLIDNNICIPKLLSAYPKYGLTRTILL